jgi:signal transduction histidine kinase
MRLRTHIPGLLNLLIIAILILVFGVLQSFLPGNTWVRLLFVFFCGGGLASLILTFLELRLLTCMRHIEQELQQKEVRYRTFIENAPLGILTVDSQGHVVDVNPMLLAMLGWPDEVEINPNGLKPGGINPNGVKPGGVKPNGGNAINVFTTKALVDSGFAAAIRMCLASGKPTISEGRYPVNGEQYVYLRYHLNPIRDKAQNPSGVHAIIEDTTERVLAENALKESEAEYRSLFNNIRSGVAYQKILFDEQGTPVDYVFLDVNKAFELLTGIQNVVGRRATEVLPNLDHIEPDLIAIYGNVATHGEETTFESFFAPLGMWLSIAAYSPEKGYCVTIFDDITERKWTEESLRKLNEELEHRVEARTLELRNTNRFLEDSLSALEKAQKQLVESEKMAALGGLVAGVTHEVSTPLGIGVTAASHLEQKTQEVLHLFQQEQMTHADLDSYIHAAAESVRMIQVNLQRAAENIKSFKQVAVDQTHDTKRPFSLKQCIDNVLLSLGPKLKRTPYRVSIDCPEDIVLDSYPGAFSQILTNLIMNALIHGFEERDTGEIIIIARQHRNSLHLSFADDGKGMNEDECSRVFEPFFTTKRSQGGTGLGLHIVYNLVTQTLRGTIECESVPGTGTRFIMNIPVTEGGDLKNG